MPVSDHRASASDTPVRAAVVTVSDTRTPETDESGRRMRDGLTEEGVEVVRYAVVRDEPDVLHAVLDELLGTVDAVLVNGGTGIAPRDRTVEVVEAVLETELPGFGELFRMLSYDEIGAAAMLSRATAGVARGTLVFATPGSPNAARLALSRLILPELRHAVRLLNQD